MTGVEHACLAIGLATVACCIVLGVMCWLDREPKA